MRFTIEGKVPKTHESVFVAPTAAIIGDVTIGPHSSVWFGAVLRGDFDPIVIGEGTCVQDNVVVHGGTTIGNHCTIAHGAIVHDSRVGDHVMIGVGAMVFGGCEIGEGAVIGMGAVVTPRTKVPPGILMLGIPAQPAGPVPENMRQRVRWGTQHYVQWRGRYLAPGSFGELP